MGSRKEQRCDGDDEEDADAECEPELSWPPKPGAWVRLCNLQASAELNGRLGEVVEYDEEKTRYKVSLLPSALSADSKPQRAKAGRRPVVKLVRLSHMEAASIR